MARHLTTGSDDGDNLLQADDRDDLLYAFAGFDNINTGWGNDLIYAGADTDYVNAGVGNDRAFGGDSLYFNGGTPGFGDKHLFGGAGNDRLVFAWNDGGVAAGGEGRDELDLTAYAVGEAEGVAIALQGGKGSASFGTHHLEFTGIELLRVQTHTGGDTVTSGAGNDVLSVHLGANHVDARGGDGHVTCHSGNANVLEATSELRWDADGAGISGGVTIAFLDGVHSLGVSDFLLH